MPSSKWKGRSALGVAIAFFAALNTVWSFAQARGPQLELSTYFGGSDADAATLVRVDAQGNYYLAGSTQSRDFPTRDSVDPGFSSSVSTVGFLTKLRPDGTIVYSRYLPRPIAALAVDADGNVATADNVTTFNSRGPQRGDFTVSKLDPNGTELYSIPFAGRGLDQATSLTFDSAGDLVVTGNTDSPDFPLVNALQPAIFPGDDGFDRSAFLTKLDRFGRIVFSTGWGGTGEDLATSVTVGRSGVIVLVGTTRSIDFPTTAGAYQRALFSLNCSPSQSPCADAFVTTFSADGQRIGYSTLFGGTNAETVRAAAVGSDGSVHLAGKTDSPDLPLRRPIQTTCDSEFRLNGCSHYIVKLNATGSAVEYATYLGSRAYYVFNLGLSIDSLAADSDGGLVVTGLTHGNDLPLVQPLLSANGGGPVFKSTDDGRSWVSASDGITGTFVEFLGAGGRASQTLYASTFESMFRSEDQGRRWVARRVSSTYPPTSGIVAVDPITPTTLYATGREGALKSTDGGDTWARLPLNQQSINSLALAPSSPSNVYVTTRRGVFHSANGGITFSLILDVNPAESELVPYPRSVAVDPQNADTVYVAFNDSSFRRLEGQQWTQTASAGCPADALRIAASSPPAIYALACGNVWRSVDGARSWTQVDFARTATAIALDRSSPEDVYVASGRGFHRSRDRGTTWTLMSDNFDHDFRSLVVDPFPIRTLYAGAIDATNAFLTRFDPLGEVTFSTYLGGVNSHGASVTIAPGGAIVVAGGAGRNLPLVHPFQPTSRGTDAFLMRWTAPQ